MAYILTDDERFPVISVNNPIGILTVGRITFASPVENETRKIARKAIEKYQHKNERKEIFEKAIARIFGK